MDTKTYNGWTNYVTWNVALWIQNDEQMYSEARTVKTYDEWINKRNQSLYNRVGTPDGVRWNDTDINRDEMNEMLAEL